MSWKISFEIIGDNFDPSKINFNFTEQNQPTDIASSGKFKGKMYNYGSATYISPKNIPRFEKFKHIADTFEPLLNSLKTNGAESWHILIERLFFAQCNEELYPEEIKQIARLNCPVAYSAYSVSEQEEKKRVLKKLHTTQV